VFLGVGAAAAQKTAEPVTHKSKRFTMSASLIREHAKHHRRRAWLFNLSTKSKATRASAWLETANPTMVAATAFVPAVKASRLEIFMVKNLIPSWGRNQLGKRVICGPLN